MIGANLFTVFNNRLTTLAHLKVAMMEFIILGANNTGTCSINHHLDVYSYKRKGDEVIKQNHPTGGKIRADFDQRHQIKETKIAI